MSAALTLVLQRVSRPDATQPTYGTLLFRNQAFAVTLERPWLNNARNVSCIPAGTYVCRRVQSPRFGNTFEIFVAGRDKVLFHWGSFVRDTEGCVLVAESFKDLDRDGVQDVAESKITPGQGFNELLALFSGVNTFMLEVREAYL